MDNVSTGYRDSKLREYCYNINIKGANMGQTKKTPRKKKQTKEDVLKKEITAAVNLKNRLHPSVGSKRFDQTDELLPRLYFFLSYMSSLRMFLFGTFVVIYQSVFNNQQTITNT